MKKYLVLMVAAIYRYCLRPLIFLVDSETAHNLFVNFGEILGKTSAKYFFNAVFRHNEKILSQELFGIKFENPIGLSAGFDYQAKLTQILPAVDFGFETIGTITNLPYDGNPKPRLGRLIKTKSLMVNKGFKNEGIDKIVKKLKGATFAFPVGLSIGKTNITKIKTQEQAVSDVVSAFEIAEKAKLANSYYELNISCPNLYGNVEFYEPQKLEQLLKAVTVLNLLKPLFVKMPISKTNEEITKMMDIIIKYPVQAVIFGNLQKDRNDKTFIKEELEKFPVGNFSGMPTQKRANELICFTYEKYGQKIKIIGCGGVFCAKDAYEKIKSGASLVQLITGLIFEGPQLVSQINYELVELLKADRYTNISQAVGVNVK